MAGTGSVALPNTTFGEGTYTATGAVTITAATAGDTIVLEAIDASGKAGITIATGTITLGFVTDKAGGSLELVDTNTIGVFTGGTISKGSTNDEVTVFGDADIDGTKKAGALNTDTVTVGSAGLLLTGTSSLDGDDIKVDIDITTDS